MEFRIPSEFKTYMGEFLSNFEKKKYFDSVSILPNICSF